MQTRRPVVMHTNVLAGLSWCIGSFPCSAHHRGLQFNLEVKLKVTERLQRPDNAAKRIIKPCPAIIKHRNCTKPKHLLSKLLLNK